MRADGLQGRSKRRFCFTTDSKHALLLHRLRQSNRVELRSDTAAFAA
jgi:hypothetical protein